MELYTLTSCMGNHSDGKYDFVAEQWLDVIEMAVKFEEDFNKHMAFNPNYIIKLDISQSAARIVPIKPGFIDIRKEKSKSQNNKNGKAEVHTLGSILRDALYQDYSGGSG